MIGTALRKVVEIKTGWRVSLCWLIGLKLMIRTCGSSEGIECFGYIFGQREKSIKASIFRRGKLTDVTVFAGETLGISD